MLGQWDADITQARGTVKVSPCTSTPALPQIDMLAEGKAFGIRHGRRGALFGLKLLTSRPSFHCGSAPGLKVQKHISPKPSPSLPGASVRVSSASREPGRFKA